MIGIFPDQMAPVVRINRECERFIEPMRWRVQPPPKLSNRRVTNVRNVASPYWRAWLKPEFRCVVPATSFCEYTNAQPKIPHWFALGPDRPLFAFAGIWRPWTGERKKEVGEHLLFSFLTTEANDLIRPVHAKAMPVILADETAWSAWLEGDVETALKLQQPLPADRLAVVATGQKQDAAA